MTRASNNYSLTFEYNEDGLRTRKTSSTGDVSEYTWHGTKLTHMKRNTTNMHFFYDAQSRPAILRYGTATYGYLYNLQGDVVAIVDSTGAKVVEYNYDAWGKQLTCTGSKATSVGKYQPFRYRGYIYDFESGLYCLRSRYYNPTWGRFISADTNIKGNLYSYCNNTVISAADYDGKDIVILLDDCLFTHLSLLIQNNSGDWYYFYWGADETRGKSSMALNAVICREGNGNLQLTKLVSQDLTLSINDVSSLTKPEVAALFNYEGEYDHAIYLQCQSSSWAYAKANMLYANRDTMIYKLLSNNCAQVALSLVGEALVYMDVLNFQYLTDMKDDLTRIGHRIVPKCVYNGLLEYFKNNSDRFTYRVHEL